MSGGAGDVCATAPRPGGGLGVTWLGCLPPGDDAGEAWAVDMNLLLSARMAFGNPTAQQVEMQLTPLSWLTPMPAGDQVDPPS